MNIKLYKTNNCKNCEILINNLNQAINELDMDKKINIEICTSILEMSKKNISKIPALEIDEKIYSEGFVYSKDDLKKILLNINEYKQNDFENHIICDNEGCRLNDK